MVAIFNRILSKVAAFRRQRRHRLDEEQAYGNEKKDAVFNPVFNKDAVSWYLITLKIKEIVDAKLKKSSSPHVPEWVVTIRGKLAQARAEEAARPSAQLSVYRVPKSLSEGDERAAYMPQVVSIGPLHAGQQQLSEMERHKWRALHHVLKRTRHDVTAFLDALRPMEDRVRACYDGRVAGMPSNEFVQCLVLDGTFVLEVFRATRYGYLKHDPIFAIRGVMHAVRSDMILLENQIPLFVLDLLLPMLRIQGHPKQTDVVASLAVWFFDPLMPHRKYRGKLESSVGVYAAAAALRFDPLSDPMLHCLDVFRRSFFRSWLQPTPPSAAGARLKKWPPPRVLDIGRQQFVHCVSELREAGIRCQRRNTDWFWDIKFEKGVLHIPRILIHHSTKALFLNLIAFEQCHLDIATPGGNKITAYAIFMDNLINSAEDVKYLHDRGIIEHKLGSNAEVADLFNRLCQQVVFDINYSYLSNLSKDVNKYYEDKWSTWVASLRHNYFTNPWKIISIVAGVFLLLLTMMQTFYSAYSYYRPPA